MHKRKYVDHDDVKCDDFESNISIIKEKYNIGLVWELD
jgi:hypothetical protein